MAESTALANKGASEVTTETTWGGRYFTPRVDIYETEDELALECDLPGVKPADLDLRFERGELTIHGKVTPRQAASGFWQAEYGVGDFYRSFNINEEVEPDKISADFKHGVLTIHLPKKEALKPKRIKITAE